VSDVVLRCPNCGTAQSVAGECEACHEAEVRYFCPNHTPGRWLDGPVCAACGARVEREGAARRTRPPRTQPPRRETPREPMATREAARPPLRPTPRRPARPPTEDWSERVRTPVERAPVPVDDAPPRRPTRGRPPDIGAALAPAIGCVGRLVTLLVVITIAFTVLPLVGVALVGGSAREWIVDQGQRFGLVEGVPAQTRRGIAAYQAGDLITAERELREAAQSYPRSGVALIYLARMRTDDGDLERAGEYLREAVAREPDNALAHRELAGYYLTRSAAGRGSGPTDAYASDDLLKAQAHYERALQLDPTDAYARGFYGCVLADLGQTVNAERMLAEAGPGPWERCVQRVPLTQPAPPEAPTPP